MIIKEYKGLNYSFPFLCRFNKNYWKIFTKWSMFKKKAKIISEVWLLVQGLECEKIKTTINFCYCSNK